VRLFEIKRRNWTFKSPTKTQHCYNRWL